MNNLSDFGSILKTSFAEIWFRLIEAVPGILGAVLILLLGFFIVKALGKVIAKLAQKLYLDKAMEVAGVKKVLDKTGLKITVSQILGLLFTWFFYAVILVAAADVMGLAQVSEYLNQVVLYLPNIIIATVILILGLIIANFLLTLVKETARAANLPSADTLARLAQVAVIVFSVMAALIQLGVAKELIQILFTGMVFMVALAGGLAFGLAGKDRAKEILDKLEHK